jgi:hypothetical protein
MVNLYLNCYVENWDLSFAHFSTRHLTVVIVYVRVPTILTPQQDLPVHIEWEAVTFSGCVWTIWSAGQSFASAGNQSITLRFYMPLHCRYADNAAK